MENNELFKQLFAFFTELKVNNNKVWFEPQKDRYKSLAVEFKGFMDGVLMEMIRVDEVLLQGIQADKKVSKVFRIYRDARFSHDKSPLKTHIGGTLSNGKMEEGNPGYYLHIEPGGKSFVAGGLYVPPADILQAIRKKIDAYPDILKEVEMDESFAERFPAGIDRELSLKVAPRDYPKDHEAIEYLRLKSFTVQRFFSDKEVLGKDFRDQVLGCFTEIEKLNNVVRIEPLT